MRLLPLLLWSASSLMAGEAPALVVHAPDSPVRIDRATFLTTEDAPPVVLYSATNHTGNELDQFTVIVFVFDDQGTLKARHIAPGRRTLEVGETKFSTIVLDGTVFAPMDQIVIGVNQVQAVGSNSWWRADIQPAAEAIVQRPQP
jgi:hypothetical protein